MLQSISQIFDHTLEYCENQTEAEFNQQPAMQAWAIAMVFYDAES